MNTKRITNCTILLALLLCIVSTSIHARNPALPEPNGNNNGVSVILNSQNFPDDVFRAYVSSITGVAEGGTLSEQALQSVSLIDVSGMGISSLEGIGYFTALKTLYWYDNHLTSLNVENNNALTNLRCFYNYLTTLDVTNNTALTHLDCYNNQIIELDVTKNPALTELDCDNNQLMTLDVTNNTALTHLYCSDNQLTSLDVSNNTALTGLWCWGNQLTALDLSNNIELSSLRCDDNQLSSLNLTKCTLLFQLFCHNNQLTSLDISDKISLVELVCSNNQLTNLDVSNNIALKHLSCGNNQLTNFDITKNTALIWLGCDGIQLTSLDISKNTALTHLWCENNQLTSLDISKNTALEWLVCNNNQLTTVDISKNTKLRGFNCEDNPLINLDISGSTALEELHCESNQLKNLNASGCTALTEIYYTSQHLTSLDVSGCTALTELHCESNQLTSLNVSECTALTTLECWDNQLTHLDVSECTALEYLDCGGNLLNNLDVSKNTALESLACGSNQLTSFDISNNASITWLECMGNLLTSLEVKNTKLTALFCDNNPLTHLDLLGCNTLEHLSCKKNQLTKLTLSDCIALTTLICDNNQLTSLDISMNTMLNYLSCTNNQLITLDASNNTALSSLYCGRNQLKRLDLSNNTALTRLDCSYNQLMSLDTNALSKLIDCYINWQSVSLSITRIGNDLYMMPISEMFDLAKVSNFKIGSIIVTPTIFDGYLFFTSSATPTKATYNYNTGRAGKMDVTVKIIHVESLENTIYMDDVELLAGTENILSVKMRNTVPVEGFEFDMYLPEGVTVVMDEDGFPEASLSTERTTPKKTNSFDAIMQADGSLRVLAASTNGSTISGNDGEIVTVKVIVDEDMAEGDHFIVLKNIAVSDANATSHKTELTASAMTVTYGILGDANTDKRLDVGDYTATAHYILGNTPNPFNLKAANANQDNAIDVGDLTAIAHIILYGSVTIPQNNANARPRQAIDRQNGTGYPDNYVYISPVSVSAGTEYTLSVNMKNDVDAEGFEFDLYLPEGMSFVVDADGFPDASLSTARTTSRKTNTFDAVIQPDGALRVLAASSNGSTISGNNGEVALVKIKIDESLAAGTYTLQLKNIVISDVDAVSHYTEERDTMVTVMTGVPTFVDGVGSEDSSNQEFYNLSGQRIDKPTQPGIYIQQGKKVVIKRVK